jgi:dihydrofolate reductase
MRTLTFGMNVSLDGYVAAPGDDLGWSVPSDELFQWWSDRVEATGLALYGRRLWETMSSHWPTADQQPGATPAQIEFAGRWREMPKVVFSSTTGTVGWNTRLVTGDAVTEITRLKAEDGGPMDVGRRHARRGGHAGRADRRVRDRHASDPGGRRHAVLHGPGQLGEPEPGRDRTFPDGVLLTRYETRR